MNTSARWRQALAAALLGSIVVLAWWAPLDAAAEQQVEAGLKRALATFAAARARSTRPSRWRRAPRSRSSRRASA